MDPNYEVEGKIDVDEFYRLTSDVSANPKHLYDRLLNWAVIAGLVMVAIIVLPRILD